MAIRSGRFGYGFTVLRILQFLCFAPIAALCIIFAAEVTRLGGNHQPAPVLLALIVSVIITVYTLIALLGHLCHSLPYIAITVADIVAAIILIVAAVFVGKPLTRLDCAIVGDRNEHIGSLGDVLFSVVGPDSLYGAYQVISDAKDKFLKISGVKGLESVDGLDALGATGEDVRLKLGDYPQWVGRVEGTCITMKAVWGLTILLVFLYVGTAVLSFILHRRIHSIRTFHVEEDEDGTQLYYTQHVPATVMREASIKSYRPVPSTANDERQSPELGERRLSRFEEEPL